ncbi:hypothetical protein B0H13DRAFT_1870075 [Mycena leptocephala]|nr:hypothetical protein B0H13DRAFT_1870075 [Mycena leptocephala]
MILILSAVAFTNAINTLDSFKDLCPPLDNNNALIDAGSFPPDFSSITCFYLDSAACTYSFALTSGPSACPTSLFQANFTFSCPPVPSGAIVIDGTFNDDNSILTCRDDRNGTCDFQFPVRSAFLLAPDGDFIVRPLTFVTTADFKKPILHVLVPLGGCKMMNKTWGGQLKTGRDCAPSLFNQGTQGFHAALGGNAAAAAVGNSLLEAVPNSNGSNSCGPSGNGIMISEPILIALLAMNGFLIIVVLAITGVWIFRRGREEKQSRPGAPRLSTGTGVGYRTVESVNVPLTHDTHLNSLSVGWARPLGKRTAMALNADVEEGQDVRKKGLTRKERVYSWSGGWDAGGREGGRRKREGWGWGRTRSIGSSRRRFFVLSRKMSATRAAAAAQTYTEGPCVSQETMRCQMRRREGNGMIVSRHRGYTPSGSDIGRIPIVADRSDLPTSQTPRAKEFIQSDVLFRAHTSMDTRYMGAPRVISSVPVSRPAEEFLTQ